MITNKSWHSAWTYFIVVMKYGMENNAPLPSFLQGRVLRCWFRVVSCICYFAVATTLWVFKCRLKLPCWEDVKSHWLHLFAFSPLCVFKWALRWCARENAKSQMLHLFVFSPLCVFKCLLKSPDWEDAKSHWLHMFGLSVIKWYPQSAFIYKKMHSHTGCICLTFLHCVISSVFSNCLPERMHSHTGCICLAFFPLCIFKWSPKLQDWEDA